MSITFNDLVKANQGIKTVDIKGKEYAQVNDRVRAFRQICPSGVISTEIISMENGVVTMKTTIADSEGNVLATGLAQEKESSSFINKTSYIENCETSAVGRALGFLGLGIDGSMCSAEELVNAVTNQNKTPKEKSKALTKVEIETLRSLCEKKGLVEADTFPGGIENLSDTQYTEAVKRITSLKDKA